MPAELIHPNLVTRYGNFEWTLDQAHFVLEPTSTRGEFRVHLDTETPGFETFLAEIDGGEKSPVAAIFPWKLHAGRNRLKVWPRNNAGRDGIASWIELEMPGSDLDPRGEEPVSRKGAKDAKLAKKKSELIPLRP